MDNVKALEMREISKSFGGVKALSCVDYSAYKGKVNVLMGENGAGKSTLMRILVGATPKDAGTMIINGKEVHIRTPFDAINHKIAMKSRVASSGSRPEACTAAFSPLRMPAAGA